MNIDKRPAVALIWGGRGYEKDVSRRGMENILPLIDENTYRALSVHIEPDGRWTLDGREVYPAMPGGLMTDGGFIKIDCSFPLLHGDFGEDGRVQGALDCANISYIGCDTPASALCRDKSVVKAVARSLGIPTLPCVFAEKGDRTIDIIRSVESELGYPAFVKPTSLGSSVGAGEAKNRRELFSAIRRAFELCDRIIIERCLRPKRELECGYLRVKGKDLFTKCGEVLCDSFYSYDKKYSSPEVKVCPVADIDDNINKRISDWSRMLVRALGIRDISRIDFLLSGDDIYFNEINTMPGQTVSSLYPKMIDAAGIPLRSYVNLLIEGALSR